MKIEQIVEKFLRDRCQKDEKLLVALSGGPDSLALLHILLRQQKKISFDLAVAHVDHRWRASSSVEANQLRDLAKKLGINFHLKELDPQALKGNLEAACRKERYAFFSELQQKYGYKAVLLGHHADDQSETVFKRLCEGSRVTALAAMQPESYFDGTLLWRPLLEISKTTILLWLKEQGISAIEDPTNHDTRYLRARCREEIMPWLRERFGKDVLPNFRHIAREAKDITDYLDFRTALPLSKVKKSSFGWQLDMNDMESLHVVECRHLVSRFLQQLGIFLSRQELDTAIMLLLQRKADRQIRSHNSLIHIDRGRLFILLSHDQSRFPIEDCQITRGTFYWGRWHIEVKEMIVDSEANDESSWKDIWNGKFSLNLPLGNYFFLQGKANYPYPGKSSLSKWWGDAKVPAFLRNFAPLIADNSKVVHELLSGRRTLLTPRKGEEGLLLRGQLRGQAQYRSLNDNH